MLWIQIFQIPRVEPDQTEIEILYQQNKTSEGTAFDGDEDFAFSKHSTAPVDELK